MCLVALGSKKNCLWKKKPLKVKKNLKNRRNKNKKYSRTLLDQLPHPGKLPMVAEPHPGKSSSQGKQLRRGMLSVSADAIPLPKRENKR